MSDFAAQPDTSGRHRGRTASEGFAHGAGEAGTAKTAWQFQPVRLIVIGGLFLIGAVIAVTVGLLMNLRDRALADSERELTRLSLVIAEEIDRSFQSVELVQTAVIERMRSLGLTSPEEYKRRMSSYDVHQDLRHRISALPHINAIVLTDSDGKLINFSRSWPIPNIVGTDNDPSVAFKSDPHLTFLVGKPGRSPATGGWVIPVARKFTGPNGEFLGDVIGVIDTQRLERNFKAIATGSNEAIALFLRDGTMFARYPHLETFVGQSFSSAAVFAELLPKSNHGTVRKTSVVDGKERLISARILSHYPIVVAVTTTVADALANWKHAAIVIAGVALMIGLAIGGAVAVSAWLVGRKLREQNLQWNAALSNMSQGLIMFDSAARLVICNDRYRQIAKLPPDLTKLGCALIDLLRYRVENGTLSGNPEKYIADLLATIALGETARHEVQTSDGRIIAVVNQPMAGGGWVATHEDITKQRCAEKASEQQKLQLDSALSNMTQGLVMFDSAARLVICNDRYRQMMKLPPESVTPGRPMLDIFKDRIANGTFSGNPEQYISDLLVTIAQGKTESRELEIGDGRIVSIVNQPMADGGWVATHEDITEAKRKEASFRLLFENNPVPMWVWDLDSLRFLAVNEAAITHYGYSREQFFAMTLSDIRPPAERERLAQFVRGGAKTQTGETTWRHRKSDGAIIDVIAYSRSLKYDGHTAQLVAAIDVTERKRAADELRQTQKFLDTVIENVPIPIIVKDAHDRRYTLANRASEELFGVSRGEIIGKNPYELYPEEQANSVFAHDNEALRSGQPFIIDNGSLHTPHNGVRLISSKRIVIHDDEGKPQYMLGVLEDVTERRLSEQRIARMAHYDALTDLPNRANFNDTMDATIKRAAQSGEQFALLSIDLDRFKEANDSHGHLTGDALLREASRRLQAAAEGAFIARLGGDEFVCILTDGTQPAAAAALAERLLAALVDDFAVEGHRLKLGMSIGVAIYPTDGADANMLMANADAALYRAKAEIRGSVLFFEPEMGVRLRERRALQEDLRSGIERGELLLHYQPQKKMSGELVGFEALVRWQCPKRGLVAPGTFIPIAEESSLIIPLGEWVLREACREAASWPPPLTVAVNISPIQFRQGDLPSLVHSILLETGLAPARLELEITEGVMINDFSRAVSILNRLKSLGVRIAMDDFGTGYSSLSYLQSFRCDKIKIDRVFISDLQHNHHSRAIVRAVIGLGRSLDLPILAEGVETAAQHAFLVQEGCNEVQGFLTGRPLPIADYGELVGRQTSARQSHAAAG